jgi:ParB-like chromosome segregation protein Spo0J
MAKQKENDMGGQLLDGPRKNIFLIDPKTALVAGIDFGPEDPMYAKFYDPRVKLQLDASTVDSIRYYGVREPCEVIVLKDGRIMVTDGRRRTLHLREANSKVPKDERRLLPVMAVKATDEIVENSTLVGEMLNNHRVQDSVMVKAEKAMTMIDVRGFSVERVALSLSVTQQTIAEYRKLMSLSKDTRDAIDSGILSPSAGAKLCGLSDEEQKAVIEKMSAGATKGKPKKVTVKDATAAAKAAKTGVAAIPVPSKRSLRTIIEKGEGKLSPEFILGIKFALGEVASSGVTGLDALSEKKKAPRGKKSDVAAE